MRAYKLLDSETAFATTMVDSGGKKWKSAPGQFGSTLLHGNGTGFFYVDATPTPKTHIITHSTMGVLKGDIAQLTQATSHVSVSFVVGRSGTVYQLFDTKNWSYHLGSGATGGNTALSKASVGIELCNLGPLILKKDNVLYDYYGVAYCALADKEFYCEASYRGANYFATYTEPQLTSLGKLLRAIGTAHSIPLTFLPADKQHDYFKQLPAAKVLYHTNLRVDKSDPGPAFDHTKLKIPQ
jgi:N-acetylmuramoyl-L-alanine amidase